MTTGAGVAWSERKDWHTKRARGIGASEAAIVLGISTFKSPYQLWAEKCGLVDPADEEKEFQRWGNILEPAICEEYSAQTGRRIIDHGRYAVRTSATCPVMCCTLDREVHADDKDGPGCMDAKNVGQYNEREWIDGVPLIYDVQLQAQMEVTGWKWGSLAALIGGNKFRWMDVARNERFIDHLRAKCLEFWRLVEMRTPPPIDGTDSTAEVLKRMYPKDSGEAIPLPGDAMDWDRTIKEANEAIKVAEEQKQEAQNKIRAVMGDASYGVLPGGGRYALKTTVRKGFTVLESEIRTLRRLAK